MIPRQRWRGDTQKHWFWSKCSQNKWKQHLQCQLIRAAHLQAELVLLFVKRKLMSTICPSKILWLARFQESQKILLSQGQGPENLGEAHLVLANSCSSLGHHCGSSCASLSHCFPSWRWDPFLQFNFASVSYSHSYKLKNSSLLPRIRLEGGRVCYCSKGFM